MATTYWWTGAVDTAWATAGNWTPSGPPISTDTAIFDNTSNSITTGAGGIALAALILTPRFTGNYGASGVPIDGVAATLLVMESSGDEFWHGNSNITRSIIYPRSTGANAVNFSAGLGNMRVVSGQVNIAATCTMGALTVLQPSPDGAFIGPEVVIAAGVTWGGGTKLIVHGGRAQLYSGPTGAITDDLVEVCGGEVWVRGATIDNVFVNGGVLRHDDGTITLGVLSEGMWDSTQSADARTLTQLYQFGGVSDFRNSAGQGKPGTFIYLGGETSLPQESYSL
jgi:hypothetical protein